MTKTIEMPELVMKPMVYTSRGTTTRYTKHDWNVLEEEYLLGVVGGIEIYAGINYYPDETNYSQSINPKNPDHLPKYFSTYSKQEMAKCMEWGRGVYSEWYRGKKGLHEKHKWGLVGIEIIAFVNDIQLGEKVDVKSPTETGYAPSLNQFDFGDPVFLDPKETIRNWATNNLSFIIDFANTKRAEAVKLINDTQKKLG